MTQLPALRLATPASLQDGRRLLLIAEGFERRSTSWVETLPRTSLFNRVIVFKNFPSRESRLDELLQLLIPRTRTKPEIVDYGRFEPAASEFRIADVVLQALPDCEEVVIDFSVMSKLLIMILLYILRSYDGTVRCVYTEPMDYIPSEKEYQKYRKDMSSAIRLPSFGVHEVVRTPLLSSSVMQQNPTVLIAFTSFNEQLIRALLSNVNPARLLLINGIPPHLHWRAKATQEIHREVIREFHDDNPEINGNLERQASTLDYRETFDLLVRIYRDYCYSMRLVLSPTGSKMQALGCGLFKVCCPDVHVEYPTPESFFVKGYSSDEIRDIHEVVIPGYCSFLHDLAESRLLNG